MALEAAAHGDDAPPLTYEVTRSADGIRMSLRPAIAELAAARERQSAAILAARFHETIARMLADAAELACNDNALNAVALSGGCFANRRLLGRLVDLLEARGRQVLYHREVPSGDGGLALGQAVIAANRIAKQGHTKEDA
jgi:hydrogenase maturation protein HypF